MKKQMMFAAVAVAMATVSLGATAQNVAIVNGKAVPKARVEALAQQLARSGRPVTPDIEAQIQSPPGSRRPSTRQTPPQPIRE